MTTHVLYRFTEVLKVVEDIEIDVPKIWQYLAEVVVPVIEDGTISLDILTKAPTSIMESGKGALLLAKVLKLSEKIMVNCAIVEIENIFCNNWFCLTFCSYFYDNRMFNSPQGSGKATGLWTSSTVSYSTFKILNVEEFKKRHVSQVWVCMTL